MTNYVDGTTNHQVNVYTINTCEWGNGTHTLFATVECASSYGETINGPPVYSGHAVSAYVPVIFSNLVTRISFSEPSFDPAAGQTQRVSAVFAANSDWILQIKSIFGNAVRTTNGSGDSMLFKWDGTADGGAALPAGIYYYYISAQTNGQASLLSSQSSGSGEGNALSLLLSSESRAQLESSETWYPTSANEALAAGLTSFFQQPFPMPPVRIKTNGVWKFVPYEDVYGPQPLIEIQVPLRLQERFLNSLTPSGSKSLMSVSSMNGANNSASLNAPSSQAAPAAPERPPINPIRGLAGTFGISADTYSVNGESGVTFPRLPDGTGIPGRYIRMEGNSGSASLNYKPLLQFRPEAANFIVEMQRWGWTNTFYNLDYEVKISDLRGSSTPFNNVNVGVLLSHGTYGDSLDYAAGLCKQMYFPITSAGQYLRLSEMNLGGSGTNGLKWFALVSCNSLFEANWNNMQDFGIKPYNSNLHLLLGAATTNYTSSELLLNWAKYMNYGSSTNYNPMTIREAWYKAGKNAYASYQFPDVVKFTVAGDTACRNDLLQTNYLPTGSWFYDTPIQVYPFIP